MSEGKDCGGSTRAEDARKQFGAVRELSKDEETIETLKQIHTELELDLEVRIYCLQSSFLHWALEMLSFERKKSPND